MRSLLCFLLFLLLPTLVFAQIKIGVINDLNGDDGSTTYVGKVDNAVAQVISQHPDLVIIPGDMVAGEVATLSQEQIQAMWTGFDHAILEKFKKAGIPVLPAPGNHDATFSKERVEYMRFWSKDKNLPQVQFVDATHFPFFYSLVINNVFIMALDDAYFDNLNKSPAVLPNGTLSQELKEKLTSLRNPSLPTQPESLELEQREWLKRQLNSEQARRAQARIVFGHVPLYSVLDPARYSTPNGGGKYHEILKNEQLKIGGRSDTLEEILMTGKVDLTVFGHSHAYFPATVLHQDAIDLNHNLHILFGPCTGPGHRHLPNATQRSKAGFSLITVTDTGVSHRTYASKGEVIDRAELPEKIDLPRNVVLKRD